MNKKILLYILFSGFSLAISSSNVTSVKPIGHIIDSIRNSFVPDKRVNVFDVKFIPEGNVYVLKGITTVEEAKIALLKCLHEKQIIFSDSILVLPDISLKDKTYGIVDLSVCNIRTANDFAAEMSLQGLMGMPVRVLEDKGFYRIQTPDRYIGWVLHAGITLMNKSNYDAWNRAPKVVVTSHYGFTYSQPDISSQTISDVVSGDRLKLEGVSGSYYKVSYPDGRKAYISKSIAVDEKAWRKNLKQDAASIIKTAYTLIGVPYMWGANSAKGLDCSGFVRTVLFLHDIIIPRDASQQAYIGRHIEIAPQCTNLQPGDLVFFGKKAQDGKKEHVSHVAIYIGNQRFIHSMGDVHESSFNAKDLNYDAYDLGRRLYAVRFLPYLNKQKDINTTLTNPFYQ